MTIAVQRGYDDAMSLFSDAKTSPKLLHALTRVANELGFDHAVLDYVPNRVTGMRPQNISTYSEDWVNESLQLPMGLIARDPVLQHLDSSVAPIVWGQQDYHDSKLEAMYELCQGFGLGSGLAVTVRGPHGDYACVGFSSAADKVARTSNMLPELGTLMLSATAAYTAFTRLLLPQGGRGATEVKLTQRELEILSWSRAGKTALDCSQILGISQATVHFHLKNTLQKLDVATKQQAVLKALEMRLIY